MTKIFFRACFCAAAFSFMGLSGTAKADFELGMKYYEQANFEKAFREFQQAAKFGDLSAQYNLGVMYFRGEFVSKDSIQAYAWLALAAQDAEYKERGLHLTIYTSLSDDQKKSADRLYQDLYAQFNPAAIEKSMVPVYTGASSLSSRLHMIKNVNPRYPASMLREGKVGWVDIFFTVSKDGTTRDHLVYYSSDAAFSRAVINAVRQWQYEPMMIAGKAADTHGVKTRFHFLITDTEFDEKKIEKAISKQKEKADTGNAEAQFVYAYYLDVLPSFTNYKPKAESDKNANKWYQLAANNGSGVSSFFLGQNVLNGNMCIPDPNKSLAWLLKAASQKIVDAQYLLGQELLSGTHLQKNEDQGMYWLDKAATSISKGNNAPKLRLAWILATHPDKAIRNAALALNYLQSIDPDYHDKQTYYRTAAAVYAENADFHAAEQWLEKAISDAKDLDLPLENLNTQLLNYRNKQALREAL
ncbi:TonB family protein [Undibacterium flavidum]|uniref:SEL1-like repeat protein n=1 Tax=Undibacterium flavidum TaxID=2762297 RepID=A0ABR6YG30_9BURK|nr:TonB family protein [Undibacterium flavidum]MBC3875540.1 SEL1-like repeat protein [Undibacterium flavidum]